MTSPLKLFGLLVCFLFPSFSYANIVFVDLQRVIDNSVAAQKAESEIQKKLEDFQSKIAAKRAEFQQKSEDLQKRSAVISEDVLEAERKSLVSELKAQEQKMQGKSKLLEKIFNKAQGEIRANVDEIVRKLAKENNYEAVLPKSQSIYIASDSEITEEVIKLLNKQLSYIDLTVK